MSAFTPTARAATLTAPAVQLVNAAVTTPGAIGPYALLSDRQTLVFAKASSAKHQISVSADGGVTFTSGHAFESSSWSINGVIETNGGEVLVSLKAPSGTAGEVFRSTGWNKATGDATSWTKVLTCSGPNNWCDGRWGFSQRSVAPSWSARAGEIYICEYGAHTNDVSPTTPATAAIHAWRSTDDGQTWTVIYDLRQIYNFLDTGSFHMHACAYDPYDDRVVITQGDGGQGDGGSCGIWYCNGEDLANANAGANTAIWKAVPGSQSSSTGAFQVTNIVPLENCYVLLPDGGPYALHRIARRGYRRLGSITSVFPIGNGIIGGYAYRLTDTPGAPLFITYLSASSGTIYSGPPAIYMTTDGESFTEVYRDTVLPSGGAPGITNIVGPDLNGQVFAQRNVTGSGGILTATLLRKPVAA